MKTQGSSSFSARRLGAVAVVAFALVASSLPATWANTPAFGRACPDEGVNTGTKSTSLVCREGSNGKLTWQRVRLGATTGSPVNALKAAPGSIEFHHWRPEDKEHFAKIIDLFEAENPGTKITQVIMTSNDYTNLGFTRVNSNPEAAIFVSSRGGQFDQFFKGGLLREITNERFLKANVIKSALIPATVEGKVYGIPYQTLFNNPLYNIEMFENNGWKLPKNFTELLALCRTVKAKGIIPFAWPAATRGNAGQIINSFMMNSAGSLKEIEDRVKAIESGKEDLTSDWFRGIAAGYKQMNDAGCFPANVAGYNDVIAPADFAAGKAAIYPTGSFGMSSVTRLNPAMIGNMGMMSMITTDKKPLFQGITNPTFILSVNKKSNARDQNIARAFLSFLTTARIAQMYAVASSQHVSIINVDYSANQDLLKTSDIMGKNLVLAPRFLFNNVGQVRNPLEDALIAIGSGADVNKTLTDTSRTIKVGIGS